MTVRWHRSLVLKGLALLCLAASLCSSLAVGHQLFWKRDRLLYSGKSVKEKWRQVVIRAGISQTVIEESERLCGKPWAEVESNIAAMPSTDASVAKYLLAQSSPREQGPGDIAWGDEGRDVVGFILSVLLVGGVAFLAWRPLKSGCALSFPEAVVMSLLFLCLCCMSSRAVFERSAVGFALFSLMGAAGLLWAGISAVRGRGGPFPEPPTLLGAGALVTALIAAIVVGILAAVTVPDDWDAWAIWGAKAKVLALGKGPLDLVALYGHADYPLLWPSLWAFTGWCTGGWQDQMAKAWGGVLLLLTCWQVHIAVMRHTRSSVAACLGVGLLLAAPKTLVVASWGYAEPALWLASACLISRLMSHGSFFGKYLIAGVLAAAACLTKNEGALITVAVLAAILLKSEGRGRLWVLFLPLFLLVTPWFVWVKVVKGFSSHSLAGLELSSERIAFAAGRIPAAASMIFHMWMDFMQWGISLVVTLCLSIYCLAKRPVSFLQGGAAGPFYLAGMFLIIIFHHAELGWQIGTSWDRFTLQLLSFAVIPACSLWAPLPVNGLRGGSVSVKKPDHKKILNSVGQ